MDDSVAATKGKEPAKGGVVRRTALLIQRCCVQSIRPLRTDIVQSNHRCDHRVHIVVRGQAASRLSFKNIVAVPPDEDVANLNRGGSNQCLHSGKEVLVNTRGHDINQPLQAHPKLICAARDGLAIAD
jgi:hypothetical protein